MRWAMSLGSLKWEISTREFVSRPMRSASSMAFRISPPSLRMWLA
jgi:hypothetical protein